MSLGARSVDFDQNQLVEELKVLRKVGLRRRTSDQRLPVLEKIAPLLSRHQKGTIELQIKDVLEMAASRMGEAWRDAAGDLLDFGPEKGPPSVTARRERAGGRFGITGESFKKLRESRLLDDLASHLVSIFQEGTPSDRPTTDTLQPDTAARAGAVAEPSIEAALPPTEDQSDETGDHSDSNDTPDDTSKRRYRALLSTALVIVGIVLIIVTQLIGTGTASIPTAELRRLAAESEHQLFGDQTPVQGDVSRLLGFGDPTPTGRTTYPYVAHSKEPGELGDTFASPVPTLDAMTDVNFGIGDEREFIRARAATAKRPRAQEITQRSVFVRNGQYLWLRIYIDNNSAAEPDCNALTGPTIAKHTTARVAIWDSPNERLHILRAWIYAANTQPTWITDAVAVVTQSPRKLQLVPSLSSQYSELPPTYVSHPTLTSSALVEEAGITVGNGLLGSCWQNVFYVLPVFRQVPQ